MCNSDSEKPRTLSRRSAIGTLVVLGSAGVLGRRMLGGNLITSASAAVDGCTLAPAIEIGPYFVDERLNRSDITENASTSFIAQAAPLFLTINAFSALGSACSPLHGVQIDIWHCHAGGLYSDESANGTTGLTWLRGYQVSDANGNVTFRTIYPGWYQGRTIHIHVMARWFDTNGNATYTFTTQLFFVETLNNSVLAAAPYNTRGNRDTTNGNDHDYAASMLVDTQPNGDGSYTGTIALGLELAPQTSDLIFANGFESA
jgi:protocatechuate 3,4-dioxygenase beta subunit